MNELFRRLFWTCSKLLLFANTMLLPPTVTDVDVEPADELDEAEEATSLTAWATWWWCEWREVRMRGLGGAGTRCVGSRGQKYAGPDWEGVEDEELYVEAMAALLEWNWGWWCRWRGWCEASVDDADFDGLEPMTRRMQSGRKKDETLETLKDEEAADRESGW